jgi:hypothetical protein
MADITDYLNPTLPKGLRRIRIPVVEANDENLKGYGHLASSADTSMIEIVRWPAAGWRPVDLDSGDEGGTKQGFSKAHGMETSCMVATKP